MLCVAYPALLGLDVAAIGLVQPEPKAAQRTHIVARLADHLVNLLLATSDVITWRRLLTTSDVITWRRLLMSSGAITWQRFLMSSGAITWHLLVSSGALPWCFQPTSNGVDPWRFMSGCAGPWCPLMTGGDITRRLPLPRGVLI